MGFSLPLDLEIVNLQSDHRLSVFLICFPYFQCFGMGHEWLKLGNRETGCVLLLIFLEEYFCNGTFF